jgi:hypothetical protein
MANIIMPSALKPLACKQHSEVQVFSSRKEADNFVKDKGQSAKLYELLGSRLKEKEVKWHEEVSIEP